MSASCPSNASFIGVLKQGISGKIWHKLATESAHENYNDDSYLNCYEKRNRFLPRSRHFDIGEPRCVCINKRISYKHAHYLLPKKPQFIMHAEHAG